ncbi:hypothetical protein NKE92_004430 [Salmonella enterica]|nr:hypothetical protein [Salmonella enterica]EIX0541402.1 hypothetical protein [Salmonella enterica]EIZ5268621.1 hypothetical protein [Salmonella enterica]EJE9707380.1 hypothetical protein [Salmonella enterica]EJJ9321630.1 hypothetical protein [Salmonella enterica]
MLIIVVQAQKVTFYTSPVWLVWARAYPGENVPAFSSAHTGLAEADSRTIPAPAVDTFCSFLSLLFSGYSGRITVRHE